MPTFMKMETRHHMESLCAQRSESAPLKRLTNQFNSGLNSSGLSPNPSLKLPLSFFKFLDVNSMSGTFLMHPVEIHISRWNTQAHYLIAQHFSLHPLLMLRRGWHKWRRNLGQGVAILATRFQGHPRCTITSVMTATLPFQNIAGVSSATRFRSGLGQRYGRSLNGQGIGLCISLSNRKLRKWPSHSDHISSGYLDSPSSLISKSILIRNKQTNKHGLQTPYKYLWKTNFFKRSRALGHQTQGVLFNRNVNVFHIQPTIPLTEASCVPDPFKVITGINDIDSATIILQICRVASLIYWDLFFVSKLKKYSLTGWKHLQRFEVFPWRDEVYLPPLDLSWPCDSRCLEDVRLMKWAEMWHVLVQWACTLFPLHTLPPPWERVRDGLEESNRSV